MYFLNKKFFLNINAAFLVFTAVLIFGTVKVSAQNMNPSAKKKSDFVTQDDKEFLKMKQFKVKIRNKYYIPDQIPGQTEPKSILISSEKFNHKGMITEMTEYNSSGLVTTRYKFKYDSKNRPVRAEGEENTGRKNVQVSKYDSRGYEIERSLLTTGRKVTESKTELKYDKAGNPVEIKNFINGRLNDQQTISYKDNVRIKTVIMNEKGDTAIVLLPTYDFNGKLVKEEKIEGGVKSFENYVYDEKGNLVEFKDPESKRVYQFNEKNDVIEHKMFLLDGRRQIRLVFNYNQKGLQTDTFRYDNNEKVVYHTAYGYEYYK